MFARAPTGLVRPARRNPRIASLARTLDQTRHGDEPAGGRVARPHSEPHPRRYRHRAALCSEERVHRSWAIAEAATVVWELVSFRVWDDLVNEAGMTPERYAEIVMTAVLATLAAPVPRAGDERK